jgi:PPOX class probable F420-dependent enzyme
MPKQRAAVAMLDAEIRSYLEQGFTLQVSSNGTNGYPHQVAMWYGILDGKVAFQTFAKSQKALNLRRDPRISVMLESGTRYDELKGLVIEGEAELVDDPVEIVRIMEAMGPRYPGASRGARQMDRLEMARKKVGIIVHPRRVYSWDHTKLAARNEA